MLKREGTLNKIAVMQAYVDGKTIQFRVTGHNWCDVRGDKAPLWDWAMYNYRIKPVEKPCIDWAAIPENYKYIAVDANNEAFAYTVEPHVSINTWLALHGKADRIDHIHASFKRGNCEWKETLIKRGDV